MNPSSCEPGCRDPGCPQLHRLVDAALGSGYDRAFDVLDTIAVEDRHGCVCPRCLKRMTMLHLVLGGELRRIVEQHQQQHRPQDTAGS